MNIGHWSRMFGLKLFSSICCLLLTSFSLAQSLDVYVKDRGNNPLIGTTVVLEHIVESEKRYATTNSQGHANFSNLKKGDYNVNISYIGFESIEDRISVSSGQNRFTFRMYESAFSLDEVTVSAERPLIRYEYDKMIIDPEPIADISSNTLEVLESTPGLFVDQDGGIFISGTSPAVVYINGREQRMSNDDISTLLRSLPPGSIERIEVMRTPSTRYSAASTGGIINIILKKGVKIGRFGTVRAGLNQGKAGNQFAGFTLNDSGDKTTSYLNLNYNHNNRLEHLNINRNFDDNENLLTQNAENLRNSHQIFSGYGINYERNERLNFSYDGRINVSLSESESLNTNRIFDANNENILFSEIENTINRNSDFISVSQDFGAVYKIDTIGSEWDTKLSYSLNSNNTAEKYLTEYLISDGIDKIRGNGDNEQLRHFIEFQSDLTYYLPLNLKLETGFRSTFQHYNSDSEFFINVNDIHAEDTRRTNSFNYQESINAIYAQFSKDFKNNFALIAGARLENTYMDGRQTIPIDTSFLVNRTDFFPYAYLSYKLFEMFDFEIRSFLIYRRTITRPGYQNLSPYIRYVDQFLYETGNPALSPQFTDNVEINISVDDMPLFAIGQRLTTDIFANVIYRDEDISEVAVRTYDNLGTSRETYFRAIAGIPPGGTYFFAVGTQYNYNQYDGFYGDEILSFERGSWRFFTFHALRLFGNTRLTMSGFMMTNGLFNFYELETFGQLNFGLRQNFLDNRLTVTISARDVLKTMITEFQFNQGSIHAYGDRYTDNRRFGINIRYNFGIGKREDRRNFMEFDMEE